LLEDFKQFLPESAAHAKAAAKAAEDLAMSSQTPQTSQARGESKLPPVGNFSVQTTTKDSKKRPRNNAGVPAGSPMNAMAESSARGGLGQGNANNKVC